MAAVTMARPAAARRVAVRLGTGAVSVLVLAIAYALLFSTREWLPFFDESDNFLGGYLIAHGHALYRDYFSHHMPLPYYLAAVPSLVGVSTLEGYRVFTSLIILAFWTFVVFRFRSRISPVVLSLLVLTIAIGFPQFWGQMLLAETIEGYCLLIVALYFYAYPALDWRPIDQVIIAVAAYLAAMCTLLSVYPLAVFLAYYVYRSARARPGQPWLDHLRSTAGRQRWVGAALLSLLAVTILGLLASRALATFVQDAIVFNQQYYARYDLAGDPLRVLRSMLRNDYWYVRTNVNPQAWRTADGFALLANVVAFAWLVRRRRCALAVAYAALAATANGRGEAFHDQAYYLLSFFAFAASVVPLARWLGGAPGRLRRAISTRRPDRGAGTVVASAIYLLLATAFLVTLAGSFPLAQQTPNIFAYGEVVRASTEPGDTLWIVPLDFYAYLATDRLPATRYAFYLPWLADSPTINNGIVHDLEVSRPPVIIFPPHYAIVRREPGSTQVMALDRYGRTIRAYLDGQYVVADPNDPLLQGVLLRRDRADELRLRLRAAGLDRGQAARGS